MRRIYEDKISLIMIPVLLNRLSALLKVNLSNIVLPFNVDYVNGNVLIFLFNEYDKRTFDSRLCTL